VSQAQTETAIEVLRSAAERGDITWDDAKSLIRRLKEGDASAPERTDGPDRRSQIIAGAIAVFDKVGYNRATLEDIAAEVSLKKPTLYHYFTSKHEILYAICSAAMLNAEAAVADGVASSDSPADQLRAALTGYARVLLSQRGLSVSIRNYDEFEPAAREENDRSRKRLEQQLLKVIKRGVAEGVFSTANPKVSMYACFGAINWLYSWYQQGGQLSEDQVSNALVYQLVNGLLAR
jgi:AcrR family transcriptional regulator